MTMENETRRESRLCSVVSKAVGDDPGGSGTPFDAYLGIEVAPPWREDVADSPNFPPGLWDAVEKIWDAGAIGKFTGLMPDPEYSRDGHTRVLLFGRPNDGPFAAYDRSEYLLPDGEVGPFVAALADGDLERFEASWEDTSGVRDILVCTHGANDACCGKFGYPVYDRLRSRHANPDLRVWRTSHIGGHRFAATLIDFPEGRYWGHLEPDHLDDLVERDGPLTGLGRLCRGWAGLSNRCEQIAEREILVREGWGWTNYLRKARTLEVNGGEDRAEVRIEYETPDGETGAYEATVEADGSVMTLGSSGTDPLQEVEQYRVSRLEKVR